VNPFDDPDASFFVLINDEGQHSLWPVFAAVPDGWEIIFGKAGRQDCLDFIEESWQDMRPKSLIAAMANNAAEHNDQGGDTENHTSQATQNGKEPADSSSASPA
jgi:MbtH protein